MTVEHGHGAHNFGPSYAGSVVIDIGADIGALVLFTGAERSGQEIEIGASADPTRTHSAVRERHLGDRTVYCAVVPRLVAGTYTIWRDEDTPHTSVRIRGAEITQYTWPSSQT
jgi:hypothetical protein